MAKKKIRIVEDDADIVEMIEYNLQKEGYETISALTGSKALSLARKKAPDLIILDLMLPDLDGLEICKELRSDKLTSKVPIIIVSAKSQETDKVVGLELGADDYVTKPFSPRELIARVKAVLRRQAHVPSGGNIKKGNIFIDSARYKVTVSGKEVFLTLTEFKLLEFLARRPDIVFSREELLNNVFGYDSTVYDRTVDAHVKSLRKKLGKARTCIATVRGAGYKLKEM